MTDKQADTQAALQWKREQEIERATLMGAADRIEKAIGRVPITGTRIARMLRDMAPEPTE